MKLKGELRRVAVTGLGALSPLGHNVEHTWKNLIKGQSGIDQIKFHSREKLPVTFAGEVKDFSLSEGILPLREQSRYDRFILFALHCAHEAITDANLTGSNYQPEDIGVILGVGMGGFPYIEETIIQNYHKDKVRTSPFFIPSVIPNMAAGLVSIQNNFQGINYSLSSACASSGHAISNAAFEIMLGRQKAIVTGGAESVISLFTMAGFNTMKALSRWEQRPQEASRPFDKERNGFVMGEGAGILILEDYQSAQERGANIYAEICGIGSSADANHITAPHPEGRGAIQAMKQALSSAGISPREIDYINAHGTSTPLGDIIETQSIKNVFESYAYQLSISSTKSMTGHLLGAAAGLESIFCIKALNENIVPPTINLQEPDIQCDLNYTANIAANRELKYVLNNSFGFGGTNSSLIFKKN